MHCLLFFFFNFDSKNNITNLYKQTNMNCNQVKQTALSTYRGLGSQQLAGEIQRRGFPYPSDIMGSPFSEAQKQNSLVNMLGEYEQSKCNRMNGVGYSLYGGLHRRKTRRARRRASGRKLRRSSKRSRKSGSRKSK